MIKKLETFITGTIRMFNNGNAVTILCKVSNAQTKTINELIDKVEELEKRLENKID